MAAGWSTPKARPDGLTDGRTGLTPAPSGLRCRRGLLDLDLPRPGRSGLLPGRQPIADLLEQLVDRDEQLVGPRERRRELGHWPGDATAIFGSIRVPPITCRTL